MTATYDRAIVTVMTKPLELNPNLSQKPIGFRKAILNSIGNIHPIRFAKGTVNSIVESNPPFPETTDTIGRFEPSTKEEKTEPLTIIGEVPGARVWRFSESIGIEPAAHCEEPVEVTLQRRVQTEPGWIKSTVPVEEDARNPQDRRIHKGWIKAFHYHP